MSYTFLTIVQSATAAIQELLKYNTIGTPGQSMLYQHMEVPKKIDTISDPYFVTLAKEHTIIGMCCCCSRVTLNTAKHIPSFYLRYFTFKDAYRTSGKTSFRKNPKASILRKEILQLLSGDGLGERAKGSFFHYAYVDPENSRSTILCKEFGFTPVRTFSTVIFNRLFPKRSVAIEKISSSQVHEIKELLTEYYKAHTMFSFENLFNMRDYHVVRDENNTIIAGVQANPDRWKILELPGISGKPMLRIFSALPYLNTLIKKEYRFLTLDGIYISPGHERSFERLVESLLAMYKLHTAMTWADRESDLYIYLKSMDLGFVNMLTKEVRANVLCKFVRLKKNR